MQRHAEIPRAFGAAAGQIERAVAAELVLPVAVAGEQVDQVGLVRGQLADVESEAIVGQQLGLGGVAEAVVGR